MASRNLANTGLGNRLLPDGTKPLPEPMLDFSQLAPQEHTSEKFESKNTNFLSIFWQDSPVHTRMQQSFPVESEQILIKFTYITLHYT